MSSSKKIYLQMDFAAVYNVYKHASLHWRVVFETQYIKLK
jgi:hypothetical protein